MNSVVTERFIKCHDRILAMNMVRSSRQFAISLDYLPQSLSEIVKGRRDVTLEVLRKAIERFKLNPNFLLLGEGDMFANEKQSRDYVLTVVTDNAQDEKIVHVPIPAQAGYGDLIMDPEFFTELETYSLPEFSQSRGTFRSFSVSGDSMEPSLFEGDKIVCRFMEQDQWSTSVKNGYVYVIITRNDVVVKRVKNNISTKGSLTLISDNSYYDDREIAINDVIEIWYVKVKISPFMPSPSNMRNGFSEDVETLKQTITEQSQVISNLNLTIQKLLKQNRSRV
ncbi:S24 family peptidase [Portibacter marinus]|uniref:S24 family peptidase n=1 Tax=Portibacter marinus TaxID=2898660 RepID=UPI001F18F822|nr:S24 family peptidase [Portibacter marinus]